MAKEAKEKIYEVLHTIRFGNDDKIQYRHRGDELRASDVGPGDIERFLASKIIQDPEAAVETASTDVAHDRLTRIAHTLGLVKIKGSSYSFAEKTVRGISDFRKAVTLDELESAIVKAAAREEAQQ